MNFSPHFRRSRCKLLLAELLSSLEAVEADLGDLEEVLGVVEAQRARFPHLDDAEIASRRAFVLASRRSTLSVREDLATHAPKSVRVAGGAPGARRKAGTPEREGLLANEGGGLCSPAPGGGGAIVLELAAATRQAGGRGASTARKRGSLGEEASSGEDASQAQQ